MLVRDVMTRQTCTVTLGTDIPTVARLMVAYDVGAIPVLNNARPVGIITDRDIVCRGLALGQDPVGHKVEDYMTPAVVTIKENAELHQCVLLMEQHQIRRMLVVDGEGKLHGIIAQADIARVASRSEKAELLEQVSA
ncbi:MAG TPA: CBS domain-containing protein [Candidatus Obscuribacterales bacterium]